MLRITSAFGPMNLMLHFSHSSENLSFSERETETGAYRVRPEANVALKIRSTFR